MVYVHRNVVCGQLGSNVFQSFFKCLQLVLMCFYECVMFMFTVVGNFCGNASDNWNFVSSNLMDFWVYVHFYWVVKLILFKF